MLSVLLFVATLFVIPILIGRLPADYFRRDRAPAWWRRHPALHVTLVVARNALGALLLLAGLAMLVLPGQGLLTMLVAVVVADFPGKRRFELWLIRRRLIHRAVAWIRRRRGKPPLQLPDGD